MDAALARSAKTSRLNTPIMPGDVAESLLFLASDLSRQITGQAIFVDGGVSTIFPPAVDAVSFHVMRPTTDPH
jgi:enoyl-[acyl-carrier-protein] reductase (NADH)